MKNTTQTDIKQLSVMRFAPVLFLAVLGVAVITLTGHVQAAALHDAAHDVRHATGFPCH
ncbi:CbtB domain-containing protein [Sulfitobacter sp. SK012]|uniref:CbtB domain-containing protein n=1 Tax=Sulfitobacter sp. SK012 TaxID=1389005 RepID=UPI002696E8FC